MLEWRSAGPSATHFVNVLAAAPSSTASNAYRQTDTSGAMMNVELACLVHCVLRHRLIKWKFRDPEWGREELSPVTARFRTG